MKNILFTTLSTKNITLKTSYFVTNGNMWCTGVHQQEPGAKKLLSEERIDKIVIFGSDKTYDENADQDLFHGLLHPFAGRLKDEARESVDALSSLRFLLYRLADFVYGDESYGDKLYSHDENEYIHYSEIRHLTPNPQAEDIEIVFIRDHAVDGTENLKELIRELRGTKEEPVRLFMDMQGGERTSVYIKNALLQLLSEQKDVYYTSLSKVVATKYNSKAVAFSEGENLIEDETDRYRIIDLISGMNAFLRYGKADILSDYLKEIKENDGSFPDKRVDDLIDGIQKMDDAITFCRISSDIEDEEDETETGTVYLINAIELIRSAIKNIESEIDKNKTTYIGNVFDILIDGIKADLGDLLSAGEIDIIALIEWCIKKKNYIVATAVAEDALPSYFVKHGIMYYAKSREELENVKTYFEYRALTRGIVKLFNYKDINHFFIKAYIGNLGINLVNRFDSEPNYEKTWSLNNTTNRGSIDYRKNFPVNLYTNTKDIPVRHINKKGDVREALEPASNRILLLYSFVSVNRNCLAHASNESSVTPETLEQALVELMQLIKEHSSTTKWYLDDSEIYDHISAIASRRDSIIKAELSNELRGDGYGLMSGLITAKKDHIRKRNHEYITAKNGYKDVYLLSPLLKALVSLWELSEKGSIRSLPIEEKVRFVKQKPNEAFVKLMILYYNHEHSAEDQIQYKEFVGTKFEQSKPSEVKESDVVNDIKNSIRSASGFFELLSKYATMEEWLRFCESRKEEMQAERNTKGHDPEIENNQKVLNDLFDVLGSGRQPDWKKMMLFFRNESGESVFEDFTKILGID